MDSGSNKALKVNPQLISSIVVTEGHADKIIFPSKENYFVYVKNRDEPPALVHKLGSVITKESKHD